MINAPLARACVTRSRTFATESAQRCRRSLVQVWLVKSITSRAVSLGTMVAGLSAGGDGSLADAHSSITVCACAPGPGFATRSTAVAAAVSIRCGFVIFDPPQIRILMDIIMWRHASSPGRGGKDRAGLYSAARMDNSVGLERR